MQRRKEARKMGDLGKRNTPHLDVSKKILNTYLPVAVHSEKSL